MTALLNATHDPALRSWVDSANAPGTDFPIQNLPFGAFCRRGSDAPARCGVAIGASIVDVSALAGLMGEAAAPAARACAAPVLNDLMALPPATVSALRARLSQLLADDPRNTATRDAVQAALLPVAEAELLLPLRVAGYTDFFASIHHATNAGRLFRPDQPLLPNYKHVPIAYNGRANSLQVSGEPVTRPRGQVKAAVDAPAYLPSARLDHEVELALVVGRPSTRGAPVAVGRAWEHVFGFCLLNDWSARDLQSWEYQPLGPFLAKSFATSLSPWIVTAEALAPYRVAAPPRPAGDPAPLPYLHDAADQARGALQVQVEAHLSSQAMRAQGLAPLRLSRSDASTLYWTFAQLVAHHTSNGSALDAGDVLGSGTISGPHDGALGSLLEITAGGSRALALPSGEERRFLLDGDEVTLRGFCEAPGRARIGFGECRAVVRPSVPLEAAANAAR